MENEEIKNEKKQKKHIKQDEYDQVIGELNEAKNKVLLAQADLINYRKRKDEELANFRKFANKDLILDLLQITDNFERAIKLDDNELSDELSNFLVGFKMIYASLNDILKQSGVVELDLLHQPFDPKTSEILLMDNDSNYDDEIVLDVLRKGYMLHDQIIRPAHVKVNKLEKQINEEKEND